MMATPGTGNGFSDNVSDEPRGKLADPSRRLFGRWLAAGATAAVERAIGGPITNALLSPSTAEAQTIEASISTSAYPLASREEAREASENRAQNTVVFHIGDNFDIGNPSIVAIIGVLRSEDVDVKILRRGDNEDTTNLSINGKYIDARFELTMVSHQGLAAISTFIKDNPYTSIASLDDAPSE